MKAAGKMQASIISQLVRHGTERCAFPSSSVCLSQLRGPLREPAPAPTDRKWQWPQFTSLPAGNSLRRSVAISRHCSSVSPKDTLKPSGVSKVRIRVSESSASST